MCLLTSLYIIISHLFILTLPHDILMLQHGIRRDIHFYRFADYFRQLARAETVARTLAHDHACRYHRTRRNRCF